VIRKRIQRKQLETPLTNCNNNNNNNVHIFTQHSTTVIRKRIQLPPEKAIFVFVNNSLPATSALMSNICTLTLCNVIFLCFARVARSLTTL
jgi:hypothetical protein